MTEINLSSELVRRCYEHFQHHAEFPCSASAMREAIEMAFRETSKPSFPLVEQYRYLNSFKVMGVTDQQAHDLVVMMSETHRHYHDMTHIEALVNEYRKYLHEADGANFEKEIVAAIWFHDVVYDPRRNDNEERSAEYARRVLSPINLDVLLVVDLIMDTKLHEGGSGVRDLFSDLDLSIFKAKAGDYREYALNIRREYSFVPFDEYVAHRIKILNSFVERPKIFQTKYYSQFDATARENLNWEISMLEVSPYALYDLPVEG